MKNKKQSKEVRWRHIINAWRSSNLSQKEFCRKKKISFYTFQYWRRKISKLSKPTLVKIPRAMQSCSEIPGVGCQIRLPNGVVIRVDGNFSTVRLAEIIEVCRSI